MGQTLTKIQAKVDKALDTLFGVTLFSAKVSPIVPVPPDDAAPCDCTDCVSYYRFLRTFYGSFANHPSEHPILEEITDASNVE